MNSQEKEELATAKRINQEELDELDKSIKLELSALYAQQKIELDTLKNSHLEINKKLDQLNQSELDNSIQSGARDYNNIILKWADTQIILNQKCQQQIEDLCSHHQKQTSSVQQKYAEQKSVLESAYTSKINAIKQDFSNKKSALEAEYTLKINTIKQDFSNKKCVLDREYTLKINTIKQSFSDKKCALEAEYESKISTIKQDSSTQHIDVNQFNKLIVSNLIKQFSEGLITAISNHIDVAKKLNLSDLEANSSAILAQLESFVKDKTQDLSIKDNIAYLLRLMPEKSIVLLIDEYDSLILATLRYEQYCKCVMDNFRELFSTLKAFHTKFKFSFITGITSYQKVSLFSGGNQFYDISFDPNYSSITGFTEDELKKYFAPAICRLAVLENTTPQHVLDLLRSFYNGYCFANPYDINNNQNRPDIVRTIFNPVSVQLFLKGISTHFTNFWISTGGGLTSIIRSLLGKTFSATEFVDMLAKAQKGKLTIQNNNPLVLLPAKIDQESLRASLPVFLLQSGYLTIDRFKTTNSNIVLCIPNYEVEQYLIAEELALFQLQHFTWSKQELLDGEPVLAVVLLDSLFSENPKLIAKNLYEFFMGTVSYSTRDSLNESGWRDFLYNVLKNTSKLNLISPCIEIERENVELAGRSDLIITDEFKKQRVVLEFKLNSTKKTSVNNERTLDQAITQITQKNYGIDGRYKLSRYACVLTLTYKDDGQFDKLIVSVRTA